MLSNRCIPLHEGLRSTMSSAYANFIKTLPIAQPTPHPVIRFIKSRTIAWINTATALHLVWYHSLYEMNYCTVSQKRPTLKPSVTSSNLNRFSKFLHCWKAYKIRYKIQYNITDLTLGMWLHYLGKLEVQFSADIQQIWKKMQTDCILSAPILIPPRV